MRACYLLLIAAILLGILGCSNNVGVAPYNPAGDTQWANPGVSGGRALWGLWQGVIDPAAETVEFIPLRTSESHLNALPFLEPPALAFITLETLQFNGNIIEADIGIRHPFLGLTEFTGFDVCGVFITNGSITGFGNPALRMAGAGDTRLLNPDGYSRWWNPAEFPVNTGTMYSYNDGLLGTPHASANYDCTLNGYKYFADELGPNDPVSDATPSRRGIFSAGQKNVRHYTIELGNDGLVFNYAVDTSWEMPIGPAPWSAPDDFGPGANRPEAWNVVVNITKNSLWNDGTECGGTLELLIDVYDHFNSELNTISIESPANFPFVESTSPVGGGDGYSSYEISTFDATPAQDSIDVLISVVSEEGYGGYIPGENVTAYFTLNVPVGEIPECLELVEVDKSFHSYFYTKTTQVIYDQETWEAWWKLAIGSTTPPPPPPEIDWDNEMVIAVTMGEFSTGGHYTTIDWACFDDNGDLEIHVTWHHPGPGCMVPQVFTQPWLAVKTDRYDVTYYFTEEIDIYECD
jgi:hypothetical protein